MDTALLGLEGVQEPSGTSAPCDGRLGLLDGAFSNPHAGGIHCGSRGAPAFVLRLLLVGQVGDLELDCQ